MKKFLTTPIYYANGKPHIGHACTSVVVDITKRSLVLLGHDVFFSTGLDEHGQKNQKKIEESGLTTEAYLSEITKSFKELFSKLDISYDDFINTTSERHQKVVKYVLDMLNKKNLFFVKEQKGLYCQGCEQFKEEKELDEHGCCPDHKVKPIDFQEKDYFFDLDKNRDWLLSVLNDEEFLTDTYRKEMINLVKDGIPPLCVTRPKERVWLGIEVPFDKEYVTYVWFDALINYLTVLGYPDNKNYAEWWENCSHFLAKDIVKTHSIYWPIMLKAMGLKPPRHELVHGYLTTGGDKMGKSLGNGLDPEKAIEIFGSDALRWCLCRLVNKVDAELNYEVFLNIFNNDLANIIGNAFYRTYSMAQKSFVDGKMPSENFNAEQKEFLDNIISTLKNSLPKAESIEECSILTRDLIAAFRLVNGFIDKTAPWSVKDTQEKNQILLCVLEAIRLCFETASVIMPKASAEVFKALGVSFNDKEKHTMKATNIKQGFALIDVKPLFLRMKQEDLAEKLKG